MTTLNEKMTLRDVVTRFELRVAGMNEAVGPFAYIFGEAAFTLHFIHADSDKMYEYEGFLRVKMDSFNLKTREMVVHVTRNLVPGISFDQRLITLHFQRLDVDSNIQIVTRVDGLNFDPSTKINPKDWIRKSPKD